MHRTDCRIQDARPAAKRSGGNVPGLDLSHGTVLPRLSAPGSELLISARWPVTALSMQVPGTHRSHDGPRSQPTRRTARQWQSSLALFFSLLSLFRVGILRVGKYAPYAAGNERERGNCLYTRTKHCPCELPLSGRSAGDAGCGALAVQTRRSCMCVGQCMYVGLVRTRAQKLPHEEADMLSVQTESVHTYIHTAYTSSRVRRSHGPPLKTQEAAAMVAPAAGVRR